MENRLLFSYTLSDAWSFPISEVRIIDGEPASVCFDVRRKGSRFAPAESASVTMDADTLAKVKALLRSVNVSEIERPEHVIVMDGYTQTFVYSRAGEEIRLLGSNIVVCKEEPSLYPNAMTMIRLLQKLKALLTPLGVDRSCFSLSRR
jgi:hypothetical protein